MSEREALALAREFLEFKPLAMQSGKLTINSGPAWLTLAKRIRALEAAAYKRGQEDMRERAAKTANTSWNPVEAEESIRALPIMDPPQ